MSFQILYEDRYSNAVDEYGRPESMDYIIDEERCALETVSSHIQYLHNQPQENNFDVGSMEDEDAKDNVDVCMKEVLTKRAYTLYTDQDKVRFFKLMFENVMSVSAAAKRLGIHVRTAQRWAQMYKTDPDSIFIKYKKTGRSRILQVEYKQVILEYIDENPSAVLEQVMDQLLQKFQDFKVSKSTVNNFVRTECNLSLKKPQFQPVDRSSEEKIQERFDWVHKWKCTDMDFRTNCIFLDESAFHINLNVVWLGQKKKKDCLL
ncbi:hypothetical protein BCV72DRAFT_218409 [Rhizopus microsporus var. microsporus]|uniref:Homeodomain-like DNA binding domain-containing transcription factor n=1 Tax=Rhizopus microsporus var. microsporus TaxID=86635 RepID=A0A1X0QM63_RHIZD|nr:hypothetical protein BCV72DRAFT_218409 [Rhizopus microsporus var. microsporus]